LVAARVARSPGQQSSRIRPDRGTPTPASCSGRAADLDSPGFATAARRLEFPILPLLSRDPTRRSRIGICPMPLAGMPDVAARSRGLRAIMRDLAHGGRGWTRRFNRICRRDISRVMKTCPPSRRLTAPSSFFRRRHGRYARSPERAHDIFAQRQRPYTTRYGDLPNTHPPPTAGRLIRSSGSPSTPDISTSYIRCRLRSIAGDCAGASQLLIDMTTCCEVRRRRSNNILL